MQSFDAIVVGAGPAGFQAAHQAARAGRRVLLVEREPAIGGECVYRGTIPSKTLRETAVALKALHQRTGRRTDLESGGKVSVLMSRLSTVLAGHEAFLTRRAEGSGVQVLRGRARFESPHELDVLHADRTRTRVTAPVVVIASGSRPRQPENLPIDHENVLDSDSILSLAYLPRSLCVLGAGVIAAEWASIFSTLGVEVTIVDKGERPVAFLDAELTDRFVQEFEAGGGRFLPGNRPESVRCSGPGRMTVELSDGAAVEAEKVLVALGRVASLDGLAIENAGLETNARGHLPVDEFGRTATEGVYAVGDVVGPPGLAAAAMEQGRRAMCHALGLALDRQHDLIPAGIFTIPEMACVGQTEAQADEALGGSVCGRADFEGIARGVINGSRGFLKLVCDPDGERIVGVHVVGEGATELVGLGQMAILGSLSVDTFINGVFNFPTYAEAYRVAALEILESRRPALRQAG